MDWSMVIAIMSLFSSFLSANKLILDGIVHISKDPCICVIQYVFSLTNRTTGEVQQHNTDANMFDSRFSFHRFNSPLTLLISLMMLLSWELIVTEHWALFKSNWFTWSFHLTLSWMRFRVAGFQMDLCLFILELHALGKTRHCVLICFESFLLKQWVKIET